ncbi:Kinesin-like protein kip2 [Perkinsus chesapeaki]|uniref:Kinesin-like protein n=1 Tax=Perkinsus chesapeaki TaxID=330153 RepID=A0A7J6MY75_PERCH|nr:Kinesin-like protein kip2 [Perkinsus chesapeaki]
MRSTAKSEERNRIRVAVRLRPLLDNEIAQGHTRAAWQISGNTIALPLGEWRGALRDTRRPSGGFSPDAAKRRSHPREEGQKYEVTVDSVFSSEPTREVYEELFKDTVGAVKDGLNGALLAYGQTGSGKTYSMFGCRAKGHRIKGIAHYAAQDIFAGIDGDAADTGSEYLVRMSYLEVYNERVNDLLRPLSSESRNLAVREDMEGPGGEFYVEGLKEKIVRSSTEIISALERAEDRRRAVASSQFNEISSRSHALCFIKVESKASGDELTRVGTLCIVDLAGSERADDITNRLETCSINKSLFFLREIVNKLATVAKPSHVPWRDSKLTQLLVPFLSPQAGARSAILVTLHPGAQRSVIEHSVSSLRFAIRASAVTASAKPMVHYVSAEHSMIAKQRETIEKLRAQIEELKSASPSKEKASSSPDKGVNYVSNNKDLDAIVLRLHQAASNLKRRQAALVGTAEHLLARMDGSGSTESLEELSHDEDAPCTVCKIRRRLMTAAASHNGSGRKLGGRRPHPGNDVSQLISAIDFQNERSSSPSETTADNSDDSGTPVAISETASQTSERLSANKRVEITILRQQLREAKKEAALAKAEIERLQDQARAEALLNSPGMSRQSGTREHLADFRGVRVPVLQVGKMLAGEKLEFHMN